MTTFLTNDDYEILMSFFTGGKKTTNDRNIILYYIMMLIRVLSCSISSDFAYILIGINMFFAIATWYV